MPIFRTPPKSQLTSVDVNSLLTLCKDKPERDALLKAIEDMEKAGEAVFTYDAKIRTTSFQNALIDAGLSQETIDSIMEQGDLSGVATNKGTKLAEAYLNENLPVGSYVSKGDVDKVIEQFNTNLKVGMNESQLKSNFEASMKSLCDNAKKFNSKQLAEMQINAGKSGVSYDIYRKDKHNGLCITNVPTATFSKNKDKIVTELQKQVKNNIFSAQRGAAGVRSGAKQVAGGEAEHQFKGTVQMTVSALEFILSHINAYVKNKKLQMALKQGDVNIDDTIKKMLSLEKEEITKGIENDKKEVGADVFYGTLKASNSEVELGL